MNALMRTAPVAVVAGLLTIGYFGLRFLYSPSDTQEERREEELQKLDQASWHRQQARRQAVQKWIALRCTLAETMQRFQELDQGWPDYSARAREPWPGSDEERYYKHIRLYVELVLRDQPEQLASVLRRLQTEYKQIQAGRETPSTAATRRDETRRVVEGENNKGR